jgi:ATP-binding cassette subfamily C (CFTR/MRP) protein 1
MVPLGIAIATVILFITENFSIKMKETRKEYIDISVPSPEYYTSYLFKVLFLWVNSLIFKAKKQSLQFEDLWDLPKYLKAETCSVNFQKYWDQEVAAKTEKPVAGALYARYRNRLIFLGLLTNGLTLLSFLNPLMIDYLLRFIQSQNSEAPQAIGSGLMVSFAYFGIQLVSAALTGQQYHYLFMQNIDIFQSLMSLIYKKSLVADLNGEESVGKVVDLVSTDAMMVGSANYFVVMLSGVPLQLLIAMWMIYSRIGWSSLIFLALLVGSTPALDKIRALTGKYKGDQLKHKDARVSLCNDGIGGMKSLKLYGWTDLIANKIQSKRTQELDSLKQMKTVGALSKMFSLSLPSISTFIMFGVSILMSNDLTPEKIFVTLSLVSMLEGPIALIFQASGFIGVVQASLGRIEEFMKEKDIQRIVDR